jgi:hypothetical protein
LRTVGLGAYEENTKNNTTLESLEFTSNDILEELYVAHFDAADTALNLENSPGLKILDARDSAFTSISIANNAPLEEFYVNSPNAIKLSNLNNLKKDSFIIQEPRTLASLNIDNIDNSEVNSKTDILDYTLDNILNTYKLANVNWALDDESEISYKKLEINN